MLDQSFLSRIVLVDIGLNGNDDSWLRRRWSSGIVREVVVVIVMLVPLLAVLCREALLAGNVVMPPGCKTRTYLVV